MRVFSTDLKQDAAIDINILFVEFVQDDIDYEQ